MDRHPRAAITFSCPSNAERRWLTYDNAPRSQAIHRKQPLGPNASDLFVCGQYDAKSAAPLCSIMLGSSEKARQKSLHVAGAATMQHRPLADWLKSLRPILGIGNCIRMT